MTDVTNVIRDEVSAPGGLTLRARVSLLAAVTAGFAVAAVSLAAYFTMRMELFHELDSSLVSRAQKVAALQQQLPETLQTQPSLSLLASEVDLCLVTGRRCGMHDARSDQAVQSGPELDGCPWLFQRIASHVGH